MESGQTALPYQAAMVAAERLLAETAEAIGPDTPALDLLACLTRCRARLSALAAATRSVTRGAHAAANER